MPPAPVNPCPANADKLVPLIDQNRQPITDPTEGRNIYQSTFSSYPPDALCQKDGAMYINHSHPVLARMEASESLKDLSDEALLEKIQHMDYEVASLAGEQITLIADLKSNQAQLKQLQALGFNAEKLMKTLGETFLEFGPIVGGMAASLTMGTKGLSHLAGLSNLLANAGMQNAQFQQATIKAFRDHFKLCGNMSRENFTLGVSYVLNLVLAWQTTKYIAKIIESAVNGTSGSTHGTDNILSATPEEIMAQGRLAQDKQLTALAGKNRAELEKLYADLKQKRDDLHGGNKGLMAVKQQILPQLERLQKENGVLAHDDNSLIGSFMHNPDPSQKWGALLGFGALGALGLIAIHQAIKADNPNKPLTPHQLRNFARAKERVLKRIANGTLKACEGKTITKDEMRAFAEEFFGAVKRPAPTAVPKPEEGGEAAPADGTRAELEMTRMPTPARAGQTHWSAPTTNGSRSPVGANLGVRPTSIPDGVPSRPEGTPVPAAMRAEWTAREQANAIWRQFTQNAEVVPQRRHQEATLIDMAYKTYQDLIKIMPPHTWDKIAWDMAHMYRIAVLTTHGDVHAQMFRGRDVYAAFWKKFGLRINLYDIWLESAKPAGMVDTMANVLQRTGMNHPSFLLTQATPVILAAAKEGARARGEPWGPQDEKRVGEDIHALAGLFNAERAARLANNVLTQAEATKRLVWSLWHMGSAARGGLRLLPAAAWYGSMHPLQASELLSQALATGAGRGTRGRATARTGGPSPRGRVLGKLGAAYNTFAWALFGAEVYIHFDNTPAPSNWRSLSPTQRTGWVISEVGFVFAEGTSSLVCNVLPGATSIIPNCDQYIVPDNSCPEGSVHMKPDFGPLFGLSPHCVPMR